MMGRWEREDKDEDEKEILKNIYKKMRKKEEMEKRWWED